MSLYEFSLFLTFSLLVATVYVFVTSANHGLYSLMMVYTVQYQVSNVSFATLVNINGSFEMCEIHDKGPSDISLGIG